MFQGIKAIFFDFDGVLFDFEPIHFACWNQLLKDKNIAYTFSSIATFHGRSDLEIASEVIKKSTLNLDPLALVKQKDELFLKNMENHSVNTEELEELFRYYSHHKMLAIVSSSSKQIIVSVLKKYDLDRYISLIVGAEEVSCHKPHPMPYEHAQKQTPFSKKEIVAIEDSEVGLQSALKAGLHVIWYTLYFPKPIPKTNTLVTCSSLLGLKNFIL